MNHERAIAASKHAAEKQAVSPLTEQGRLSNVCAVFHPPIVAPMKVKIHVNHSDQLLTVVLLQPLILIQQASLDDAL